MKTHIDLFSGIGGFALAARWTGFETIAFCEIDPYAQKVLIKNFGAVMADANGNGSETGESQSGAGSPVFKELKGSCPRIFSDIRGLDGNQFRGIGLLTAGVPCQPASVAGKRRGKDDDRWLWPEAIRVLRESNPTWAIFENPLGIVSLNNGVEFEHCLSEMEAAGYTVQPIVIPACAVDARHRRDRVWIVANSTRFQPGWENERAERERVGQRGESIAATDANQPGRPQQREPEPEPEKHSAPELGCRWEPEPELGRVASGVSKRVDRLKCLGNSIVPQCAAQIMRFMKI